MQGATKEEKSSKCTQDINMRGVEKYVETGENKTQTTYVIKEPLRLCYATAIKTYLIFR